MTSEPTNGWGKLKVAIILSALPSSSRSSTSDWSARRTDRFRKSNAWPSFGTAPARYIGSNKLRPRTAQKDLGVYAAEVGQRMWVREDQTRPFNP